MPQMGPLMWMDLFFFFVMLMFLFMWLIFFKNNKSSFSKLYNAENSFKWCIKWY